MKPLSDIIKKEIFFGESLMENSFVFTKKKFTLKSPCFSAVFYFGRTVMGFCIIVEIPGGIKAQNSEIPGGS